MRLTIRSSVDPGSMCGGGPVIFSARQSEPARGDRGDRVCYARCYARDRL